MRCENKKSLSPRKAGSLYAYRLPARGRDLEADTLAGAWSFTEYAMPHTSMVLHSLLSLGRETCDSWPTSASPAADTVELLQFLGDYCCRGVARSGYSRRKNLLCPMVLVKGYFSSSVSLSAHTIYVSVWLTEVSSTDLPKRSPNSVLALEALEDFCAAERMHSESMLALCTAIFFSQYPNKIIKLPEYSLPTTKSAKGQSRNDKFDPFVDKCITLSCAEEGIESILCSPFLEPRVPCNLVGAYLLGARQALSERGDMKSLEDFMIRKRPTIAPLWLAAIWCGRAERTLKDAILGFSSVNLPVSTWTGIPQSFIQYDYVYNGPHGTIPRANEYRITYLVNPLAFLPKTHCPPFGYSKESDLSLDVRSHLSHDHHLQSYKMFWVAEESDDILAQSLELPRRSARLQGDCDLPLAQPPLFRSE